MSNSFVEFAQVLPLARSPQTTYSLSELVSDLIDFGKTNAASNTVIVPVFQTFVLLLEADAFRELAALSDGRNRSAWFILSINNLIDPCSLRTLLDMATRNIEKIRNIRRIYESMKMYVSAGY